MLKMTVPAYIVEDLPESCAADLKILSEDH